MATVILKKKKPKPPSQASGQAAGPSGATKRKPAKKPYDRAKNVLDAIGGLFG